MEDLTEYEKKRQAYIENLDFALDLLGKMHSDWDKVEVSLAEKFPEKSALLKQSSQ
jgi:hypothetical protein